MKTLTEEQAAIILAFMDAFDETTTGVWAAIEQHMKDAGFDDPEAKLEEAKEALR